jgi:enoyl-CoA hydratase/carnithine racemase
MTDALRHLAITRAGSVATVTLDRPPVNAVDLEVIDEYLPEIRLGFFPGAGGTQRLARLVGPARALRLMMEGRRLGADEARGLGLVDEVVPGTFSRRRPTTWRSAWPRAPRVRSASSSAVSTRGTAGHSRTASPSRPARCRSSSAPPTRGRA